MASVEPDLDDTVVGVPRVAVPHPETDLDQTVARGSVPPDLVEPDAGDRRMPTLPAVIEHLPVIAPARTSKAPPYRVVLPDGTELPVVGRVYIGRRPSAPRIHVGPEPTLITLPSPAKELSSTHLELKIVGGALVATDMRSTNGTVVQLPGAAPRSLIRGESAVVTAGTRIDLGEGAVIDVLSPVAAEAEAS